MKDNNLKSFVYKCECGYVVNVFIDFGTPQDVVKCRVCKNNIKRNNND